jgi:hypothetical protein
MRFNASHHQAVDALVFRMAANSERRVATSLIAPST